MTLIGRRPDTGQVGGNTTPTCNRRDAVMSRCCRKAPIGHVYPIHFQTRLSLPGTTSASAPTSTSR